MQPLISARIMIYNNFENIERAIVSIVDQTYERIELIVSDDGSENICIEDIKTVTQKYQERFERIVVNKNDINVGTVRHENIVNRLCRGDIYAEIGADDYYYSDEVFSNAADYFSQHDELVFASRRVRKRESGNGVILPVKRHCRMIEQGGARFKKKMFRKYNYVSGMGIFFRREVFEKHGEYLEEFYLLEDYSYIIHLLLENEKIGFSNMISCVQTYGGVSSKKKRNPVLAEDNRKINDLLLYERREELDNFTKRMVEYRYETGKSGRNAKFKFEDLDILVYCIYIKLSKGFRELEMKALEKCGEDR